MDYTRYLYSSIHSNLYFYIVLKIGIDFGATISAPHMHAYCLEYLADKLTQGASVLDVGSGTGIFTVLLAQMVL